MFEISEGPSFLTSVIQKHVSFVTFCNQNHTPTTLPIGSMLDMLIFHRVEILLLVV